MNIAAGRIQNSCVDPSPCPSPDFHLLSVTEASPSRIGYRLVAERERDTPFCCASCISDLPAPHRVRAQKHLVSTIRRYSPDSKRAFIVLSCLYLCDACETHSSDGDRRLRRDRVGDIPDSHGAELLSPRLPGSHGSRRGWSSTRSRRIDRRGRGSDRGRHGDRSRRCIGRSGWTIPRSCSPAGQTTISVFSTPTGPSRSFGFARRHQHLTRSILRGPRLGFSGWLAHSLRCGAPGDERRRPFYCSPLRR